VVGTTATLIGLTAGVTVTIAAAAAVARNFDVAMIVVVPGATAVTTPAADTVATPGLVDVYVTPLVAPVVSSETEATNVAVWPTVSEADDGVIVTCGFNGGFTSVVLLSQAANARALSERIASLRNADVRVFMCSPPKEIK